MERLYYSKTHEWARREDDNAVVGISDYAQQQLGDIVYIELPELGGRVTQFTQCVTIESTKSAAESYAPLSGEVVAVNKELTNNPQWINESPYEKGWMYKLKIDDSSQEKNLLTEEEYNELVAQES